MPEILLLLPIFCIFLVNLPLRTFVNTIRPGVVFFLAIFQVLSVLFLDLNGFPGVSQAVGRHFFLGLHADSLSALMLLLIGMVIGLAAVIERNTPAGFETRENFGNLLIMLQASLNGIVLCSDIFSLYVFLEGAAIVSFILIAIRRDLSGYEGSFKYIATSSVGTLIMLSSIALMLMIAGGTSFTVLKAGLVGAAGKEFLRLGLALFLVGVLVKGGLVPFHGWVPDAYAGAPSSVSLLLAGVVSKVSGMYTLIRMCHDVLPLEGPFNRILLGIGLVSVVIGALGALGQTDVKRMLAFSSISQNGYILLGLGSSSVLGFVGAVFHFFNHAVLKSLLFSNVAALEDRVKTIKIEDLRGIGNRMPLTAITSTIGALSTAGLPPLSGFWSKFIILFALWKSGYHYAVLVAAWASLLTLAYFLTFQRKVFFTRDLEKHEAVLEAGPWILFPAVAMSVVTIVVGVGFPWFIGTILIPVKALL